MTDPGGGPDLSRRNLLQGSTLLMGNAILQAIAGLAAQLVLMNLLLPEQFGRYALIAAGIGVAQMLLSLRTQILIIRAPADSLTPIRRGQYVTVLLLESLAVSVITLIWLWLIDAWDLYAAALLLSLVAGQFVTASTAFFERAMAYRRIAASEGISFVVGYASAIGIALAGAPLAALYVRELLAIALRAALLTRLGALRLSRPRRLSLDDWRSLIREGRDLWAEGLVEGGFTRLLAIGVAACAGQHGLGLFTQSQRLASLPHMVLQPLVSRVAASLFARLDDRASRQRAFLRICLGLGLILGLAAIAALMLAEPVIPPLFGAHWAPAVPVFCAMVGIVLFTSLFEIGRTYCMMRRMTRIVMAARAVQYAVMIAGFLLALERTGAIVILAGAFSVAMALSFVTIAIGIWRADRPA